MRSAIRSFTTACAAAALAACSDVQGPGGQLTTEEASFVASEIANASLSGLEGGMGAMPASAPTAPGDHVPPGVISWNKTYEVVRECPAGGTSTVSGSVTGEFDRETRTGTLTVTHILNMVECARQRNDLTITLTTSPPITMEGTINFARGERGRGEFTKTGVFFWEASDGRSGSCEVNFTITWGDDNGRTVTGTMCRREINQLTS